LIAALSAEPVLPCHDAARNAAPRSARDARKTRVLLQSARCAPNNCGAKKQRPDIRDVRAIHFLG
jgi:hypothetical protein